MGRRDVASPLCLFSRPSKFALQIDARSQKHQRLDFLHDKNFQYFILLRAYYSGSQVSSLGSLGLIPAGSQGIIKVHMQWEGRRIAEVNVVLRTGSSIV